MIKVKIEKLCGDNNNYNNENLWLLTHPKFCRIGDIVRINDVKNRFYKCISNAIWDTANKDWDIRLEIFK